MHALAQNDVWMRVERRSSYIYRGKKGVRKLFKPRVKISSKCRRRRKAKAIPLHAIIAWVEKKFKVEISKEDHAASCLP